MKNILQIKVTLKDTSPPVWRRLLVADDTSLYQLHHIIQLAFGWENYHLYCFKKNNLLYGNPLLMDGLESIDDKTISIGELLDKEKEKLEYEYDFGDSWQHIVVLEKIIARDSKVEYPICMAGKMACPPEDCGSTPGYENLKEVMKNKNHPQYEQMVQWLGRPFQPKALDLHKTNMMLDNLEEAIDEYEANF